MDPEKKSETDEKKATEKDAADSKAAAGDVDPEVAELQKDPARIRKALDALKKANKEAETRRLKADADEKKALEEQGKFKELADKNDARAKTAEDVLKQRTINWALKLAAVQAGAIDPDDIAKLIDRTAIKLSDDGETVEGVDVAMKALAEKKPHLFGDGKAEGEKPAPKTTPLPSLKGVVQGVSDPAASGSADIRNYFTGKKK